MATAPASKMKCGLLYYSLLVTLDDPSITSELYMAELLGVTNKCDHIYNLAPLRKETTKRRSELMDNYRHLPDSASWHVRQIYGGLYRDELSSALWATDRVRWFKYKTGRFISFLKT